MKYTIELDAWEAVVLANVMKIRFQKSIERIDSFKINGEVNPEFKEIADFETKEQNIYNKVYKAIWHSEIEE